MENLLDLIQNHGSKYLLYGFLTRDKKYNQLSEYYKRLLILDFVKYEVYEETTRGMIPQNIYFSYDYYRIILLLGTKYLLKNGQTDLTNISKNNISKNFEINSIEILRERLTEIGVEFINGKGILKINLEFDI